MPINEEVLLRIRTDWQGAAVQRGLRNLEQQVHSLGRSIRSALNILLPGAGVGIVGGLALAAREAVRLSSEFQKMQIGFTAILGSYGKIIDAQGRVVMGAERFNQLMRISADLMKDIRREADRTILETSELMEYMQTGLGYGMAKGLTPTQIVQLISQVATAGRTLGLPQGYPIISEIRALMTGEGLARSQVAQALGIRAEDIKRLSGEQYLQYMRTQLQGFVSASEAFAQSFEARWSTFISKIREILIDVGDAILPILSDFAKRAADAIQRWRESGGPQRLKQDVRAMLDVIASIANWLGNLIKWIREHPQLAVAIPSAMAGAKIGSLFGPKGATIGGGAGGLAGIMGYNLWGQMQPPPPRPTLAGTREKIRRYAAGEQGITQDELLAAISGLRIYGLIDAATEESLYQSVGWAERKRSERTGSSRLTGTPRFLPTSQPSLIVEGRKRQREQAREDQKRIADQAAQMQADRRERVAAWQLQDALQAAEAAGWTEASISKVQSAIVAWKQAALQAASLQAAGEPPAIASEMLKNAKVEIGRRERDVQEQIQRGRARAAEEAARNQEIEAAEVTRRFGEWVRTTSRGILTWGREPFEERAWQAMMYMMPTGAQVVMAPLAEIFQAYFKRIHDDYVTIVQERIREEQERARLEWQMQRELQRQREILSGIGAEWSEAFGVPPERAGAVRLMMANLPYFQIYQLALDEYARAQLEMHRRWQKFWEAMGEFAADSVRSAFVQMTMDLMENLGRWQDAFKNFADTIRRMIQRAIAEIIYEQFVKRVVEQLIAQVIAAISKGKGSGLGGQKLSPAGRVLGGALLGGLATNFGLVGIVLGALGGLFGFLQHGGTMLPRQIGWVGERGPELVVSGATAAVLSSQRMAEWLGRLQEPSLSTINVYVNSTGDLDLSRRIGREVERALRRYRY